MDENSQLKIMLKIENESFSNEKEKNENIFKQKITELNQQLENFIKVLLLLE